ncbi:CMP-N-acetylneuraminate-beta-galactosamide-alpha-2,3-sialyltransferase 1-like [Ptychodera flava]|uniref:CMP-N-acetylneuraminate-beta-galactosamide- alpha-2,3-sialyltransferase 1-like n=1 Tax=Ptychodera flava TaxID=63121 RepID=UPI003969BD1D
MKTFKYFLLPLVFAGTLTCYFILQCHRSTGQWKFNVFIPKLNFEVNPKTVAALTSPPVFALKEDNEDDLKLRRVLHVDGPLNLTEDDIPKVKKGPQLLYTYQRPPTLSKSFSKPNCAKSFRKVPGRSKWFNQRFEPRIKLFLDKDDINNWGNFYNLTLCPDRLMGLRMFDRRGLIRLVNNDNYSTTPIIKLASPDKCARCAVVGNSGVLLGSKAGAEIDSYEYVFRVNTVRLHGFEQDVGSKTNFYNSFVRAVYVKELTNITNVYFITHMSSPFVVSWLEELVNGSMASKPKSDGSLLNPRLVRILHPDFIRYFKVRFLNGKGRFPSTGALTAAVALHVCDEIKLFGFGVSNSSFVHYYDSVNISKITNRKSQRKHNFINEWTLWQSLQRSHIVSHFTPSIKEKRKKKPRS